MRLKGLVATATAALLSGFAAYGVALAGADEDDGSPRGSRPAAMQHHMTAMHREMARSHAQMMRDPEMREMHRRMTRDAGMREMRGHDARGG